MGLVLLAFVFSLLEVIGFILAMAGYSLSRLLKGGMSCRASRN
jgi:uncharacterized membrane protein